MNKINSERGAQYESKELTINLLNNSPCTSTFQRLLGNSISG